MKDIRIIRLVLDNFKCHQHMELQLDGCNATLYGDNATGKTSVYDALTWLLFGKDSAGNGEKNIEIKPLDSSGAVIDHNAITSVEAELEADGESMVLKRTYRELWSTKRGFSEATYDGNTSEYFWDGIPCQKRIFDGKIQELVPEETFRLLTSVSYFPGTMKWQDRRAVLFDMASTLTDREIMEKDPYFDPLAQAMGRHSLDDLRKKLASDKKGYVGVKNHTPARLEECQKTVQDLQGLNFEAAKEGLALLETQQQELSTQLAAFDRDGEQKIKRTELENQRMQLRLLEQENQAYRSQQAAGNSDTDSLKNQLRGVRADLVSCESLMSREQAYIASLDTKIEGCRSRWMAVNGETFDGGICVACGQPLPIERLQAAQASFTEQKNKRLNEIMDSANELKESKAAAENRIIHQEDRAENLRLEITALEQRITEAENNRVEPMDMADYATKKAAIQSGIQSLQAELDTISRNSQAARAAIAQQLDGVYSRINEQRKLISLEGVLEYSKQREKEIRDEANAAAKALESIDQLLFLADEYTRFKTQYVENGINSLFRLARFRLFREQANGGVEDRCDVVFDGVPYISLNNGMKINIGIDIINALSRHYGLSVPLFVDNAESVTRLEAAQGQVIRLYVSESDKELRVEHED